MTAHGNTLIHHGGEDPMPDYHHLGSPGADAPQTAREAALEEHNKALRAQIYHLNLDVFDLRSRIMELNQQLAEQQARSNQLSLLEVRHG